MRDEDWGWWLMMIDDDWLWEDDDDDAENNSGVIKVFECFETLTSPETCISQSYDYIFFIPTSCSDFSPQIGNDQFSCHLMVIFCCPRIKNENLQNPRCCQNQWFVLSSGKIKIQAIFTTLRPWQVGIPSKHGGFFRRRNLPSLGDFHGFSITGTEKKTGEYADQWIFFVGKILTGNHRFSH